MNCIKCGTELPVDAIFCLQCGTKIECTDTPKKDETENTEKSSASAVEQQTNEAIPQIPQKQTIKDRLYQKWKKLSLFEKMMTVLLIICSVFCLVAFACSKIIAGFIGIMQLCLLIIGLLIKQQIIKTSQKHIYIILIAIAFALFIPYFNLMSASEEVITDFSDLPYDSEMESTEVLSDLIWPDSELANMLPIPKSTKGYVLWEYSDEISIYVGETTPEDYSAYITNCVEKGFSIASSKGEDFYYANNESGYRLSVNYQPEQAMVISVEEPLYTVQVEFNCTENLLFSRYDVDIYVDYEQVGTLEHGTTDTFEIKLGKGDYTVSVVNEDDDSVDGTVTINVSESTKFVYSIQCQSDQIKISEEYIETLETLANGQIKMPQSADEYCSEIYANVISELKSAGFTNIKGNAIYDLAGGWLDIDGDVEEISVDGRTDFRKAEIFDANAEIIITYHTFELSSEEMWAKITDKGGQKAVDILDSFDGTGYTITCYVSGEVIDNFSPEEYIFENGWLNTDEKIAHLNFTTEALQALLAQLEEFFPQENAKRAAVVALTNCQATDVFNADGYTYNEFKFHSYSDISGFYLTIIDVGNWKAIDEHTWHVEDLKCMMSGTGTYLKASLDVSFDGTNYVVSNVDKIVAAKEYIDSEDSSKINLEHLEPTENTPYLTISPSMIEEDRDTIEEKEQNNKTLPTDERTSWIENQFSFWDGAHTELEKLIKKNLNDEKSYKHIETSYIDVINEETKSLVNDVIANMGYQVEIGDLFVITDFSAKNAFNATIKSTAYGIVSYDNNTVTLIGIE